MAYRRHDMLYILLVLVVLAAFCCSQVINVFIAIGPTDMLTWFTSDIQTLYDNYETNITPEWWTLWAVWGLVYLWQLVWIIFAHVIIFMKSPDGQPLYTDPPIVSPVMLAVYALTFALNITWLFLFDRGELIWSLVIIMTLPATLCFCIGHNCWMIKKHRLQLYTSGRDYLACNYLYLQNGLGVYAGWATVWSLYHLSIVLVYSRSLSDEIASIISVSILGGIEIVYFVLEVTSLEKHLRYMFTPWLSVMLVLCGIMVENWDLEHVSSDLTLAVACLACVLFVCKAALTLKKVARVRKTVELYSGEKGGGFDNVAMGEIA